MQRRLGQHSSEQRSGQRSAGQGSSVQQSVGQASSAQQSAGQGSTGHSSEQRDTFTGGASTRSHDSVEGALLVPLDAVVEAVVEGLDPATAAR